MIIYTDENLFLSPAQTLVNTVNTFGIMGKGLAKEFKKYYPDMYRKYRYLCQNNKLKVGQLQLSKEEPEIYRKKETGNYRYRWVLNFPTKKNWRYKSKIEYIELGLEKFVKDYQKKGIKSISFPQLGIKNGGLSWADVKPVMETYLKKVDIPVYIHIYHPDSETNNSSNLKKIKENLNNRHDAWEANPYLDLKKLKENNQINCDGIVLPDSMLYKKDVALENIKKLSVMDQKNSNLIWLQKDTKNRSSKKGEQMNLF